MNKTLHFGWHEIAGASVKSKMVILELNDTRAYEKKLSWLTRFNLVARSIVNGAPFVIGTMELNTKADEIQALILEGIERYGNRRNESRWQDDD
ncbi:MAG: hypothetical protein JXA89_19730 [Anaerolineae bacterium]|nr:hypothetical protein [Anaerolineae bacterium]